MRQQYANWAQAKADAFAGYLVAELDRAQAEADRASHLTLDCVHDYPARPADVLLLKLCLRFADDDLPQDSDTFGAVVADVARLLAS